MTRERKPLYSDDEFSGELWMGVLDGIKTDCKFCESSCMICYAKRIKELEIALKDTAEWIRQDFWDIDETNPNDPLKQIFDLIKNNKS